MGEVTPWFDAATTCPDKPGAYEVRDGGWAFPFLCYWDGSRWYVAYRIKGGGIYISSITSYRMYEPGAQWRGFTRQQSPEKSPE